MPARVKKFFVLSFFFRHTTPLTPKSGLIGSVKLCFDDHGSFVIFRSVSVRPKHLFDLYFDHYYLFNTRCLYGNYRYRPPFPRLPQISPALVHATCSVCGGPFSRGQIHQAWISLRVATDMLPLLVYACSEKCIEDLPKPAFGYLQRPHFGGLELEQPSADFRQPPLIPS
jgi:hypothetical protein